MTELFCCLVVLFLIAFVTGYCQVRDSVRTSPRFWYYVLYFKRNIGFTAVCTFSLILFQKIFSYFVALKFSLLIFNSRNFGILHFLSIKSSCFYRNAGYWKQLLDLFYQIDMCL